MALNVAYGSYTGDGSDNRSITPSTSFAIKFVYIKRADASAIEGAVGSISGMGDASFDGFQNAVNVANQIQSMGTGSFQIGTDVAVNNSGTTYHYFCIGGDTSEIVASTYTGNATDNRAVTGVGFLPELVIIKGSDNGYANIRFGTTGDSSQYFGDVQNLANYIQSLDSDGFTVGTGNSINNSGVTYYYLAVKSVTGQTKVGSYTGNTTDNRDITGIGFTPELVFLKANSNLYQLQWSNSGRSDDTSDTAVNSANYVDGIQSLGADGFQVGASANVNLLTIDYYYYAIKNSAASTTPKPPSGMLSLMGVGM